MRFVEFLNTLGTDNVESKIDNLYDKAKLSVKLAQLYSKQNNLGLLKNISTIAPLNSGVYGLYNSGENKKVIGPDASNKIKFKFGANFVDQNINKLPNAVIKQYIPDIDEKQLVPSDVIHVNVQSIVRKLGDSLNAVIEIASTIVHEATHEIDFQNHVNAPNKEKRPEDAEIQFKNWVNKNWNLVVARIPELRVFENDVNPMNQSRNITH